MYLCTELFEIEQIICLKMEFALNNLQMLICHKTQPTNKQIIMIIIKQINLILALNNPLEVDMSLNK